MLHRGLFIFPMSIAQFRSIILLQTLLAGVLTFAPSASAGNETFWVGHTRAEMVETKLESWHNIRIATLFACKYAAHETFVVLLRSNHCYVLDDSRNRQILM